MVTSRVLERGLVQRERRLRHRRAGRGARAPPEEGVQRLRGDSAVDVRAVGGVWGVLNRLGGCSEVFQVLTCVVGGQKRFG